jgi:hypothetical protein
VNVEVRVRSCWDLAWFVFVWLFLGAHCVGAQGPEARDSAQACSLGHLKASTVVSGFEFRSYKDDEGNWGACLQVLQDRRIVFQRSGNNYYEFTLGQPASDDHVIPAIANGADIIGRGMPNMVVSHSTGGAHCCRTDYVFELRPRFRLVAKLNSQDADEAHFADMDGKGRYYYVTTDWVFAYWPGSFAGSPAHEVVLRFVNDDRDGSYHLALDKMAKPAPSATEWAKALGRVRGELALERKNMANALPTFLWSEVMDLIYTGHPDLAWKFLDEAGPEAQAGTLPNLADFCSVLKTSQYWGDLKGTMRNAPPTCRDAVPGR